MNHPAEHIEQVTALNSANSEALNAIRATIRKEPVVVAALAYGSSLYGADNFVDIDVAFIIPSRLGIVEPSVYRRLRLLRKTCLVLGKSDIDIVPHTRDELDDSASSLWSPKHYPSLFCGLAIKGSLPIRRLTKKDRTLPVRITHARMILHETRTITRRQIVRSTELPGEMRIYLSKLLHGPGNALTYLAECKGRDLDVDPSNIPVAFARLDSVLKTDSTDILRYFANCKKFLTDHGRLPLNRALNLLRWYECLMSTVLGLDRGALKRYLSQLTP